ncbi:hypothetical protein [Streptomyces sp. NPDC058045]|uniref:hypothetical protein n=1 Tax=Streptomyces sp. NPDC058045 TaxID=3346311 RepID=UPI0036F14416
MPEQAAGTGTVAAGAGRVPAAERGATRIADRVVAKIAARAAREALRALPEGGSVPHATVQIRRDIARVRISLDLEYPSDLGAQCGAVRQRVVQRVRALAGMSVPEVVVQVERLHSAELRGAGQGRTR